MTDYPRFHQDRLNLILHIFAVPAFALAPLAVVGSLVVGHWAAALFFAAVPAASLAVQGYGHKREPNPPLPFDGPGHFARRILKEQYVTFPRFVLSGGWARALRRTRGS